jgi:hypothetical protein
VINTSQKTTRRPLVMRVRLDNNDTTAKPRLQFAAHRPVLSSMSLGSLSSKVKVGGQIARNAHNINAGTLLIVNSSAGT